jgi:hypothetical protein
MATVNSTTYEAQAAGKVTLSQGVADATLHVVTTTYEASAAAANTVINLFKLPKDVVIQNFVVAFDDLGTGVTIDIGDAGDIDRYVDGLDVATAAGSACGVLVDGLGYVIGTDAEHDDTLITAKVLGAAATGTIKVACYYSM